MSDDEAVKALREFAAINDDLIITTSALGRDGKPHHDAARAIQSLLAAAPALLARIEAGEGLLREAREWLASMSMQQGRPSKVLLKDIDAIAVFLAAKEADRG